MLRVGGALHGVPGEALAPVAVLAIVVLHLVARDFDAGLQRLAARHGVHQLQVGVLLDRHLPQTPGVSHPVSNGGAPPDIVGGVRK